MISRAGGVINATALSAPTMMSPGASVPEARRAASKRSDARMPWATAGAMRASASASLWLNAPLLPRRARGPPPRPDHG